MTRHVDIEIVPTSQVRGRLSSSVEKYDRSYPATSTSQADQSQLQGSLLRSSTSQDHNSNLLYKCDVGGIESNINEYCQEALDKHTQTVSSVIILCVR